MHTAASGSSTTAASTMDCTICPEGVVMRSNQASTSSSTAVAVAAMDR